MRRQTGISRRAFALGALAPLAAPAIVRAQGAWPNKPITLIVPFAAGGPTDAIARIYAEFVAKELGQSIVVENVAGAGGTTGSTRAAKAAPDGYTIQIGQAGTHVSAVGLYKNLAYNPVTDYEHLGLLGDLPQVLIVKKDLPVKSFGEFITYIRANEGKMNAGTAGPGSSSHMGGAMLNVRLGTKVPLIAYRGTGPAMNDLVGGQIDYMVEVSLTAMPQIQAGNVRPLAVFRSARIATLPDVPSTNEFGVQGLDFPVWLGYLAPKGTPAPVIQRFSDAIRKATADAGLRQRLAPLGLEMPNDATNTPAGFKAFIQSEIDRWVPVIKQAGLQLD
ncbi:MAG: Bug family tripartite tricarboxylate transporter substrate binding protein [Bosea sp. (in: a-proteobacteria)]